MNIQHSIAEYLSGIISNEQDKPEDRILVTYGIEVFLNEFTKFMVACVLGAIIGQLPLILYETIYLLLMRRYTEGLHFQSNVACFAFTEIAVVLIPFIGIHLHFSFILFLIIFLVVGIILFTYVPKIKKIKAFIVYVLGLLLGGIGGWPFVHATILVAAVVALTTIKRKRPHLLM